MTTPHEYMDEYGEWNLHSYHNSDLYNDPDYIASDADDQLPLISTIGAGPRGAGVALKRIEGTDGYRIAFINDQTGETIEETPDLSPATIEIDHSQHDMVDGETGHMIVTVRQGNNIDQFDVPIPAGAHGSRVYLSDVQQRVRDDKTYITTASDLIHYGLKKYGSKPMPRPGDIVVFNYTEGTNKYLGFGTIEAVERDGVTFTSRTSIGVPIPQMSDHGTWIIDGVDTGIMAQGPQGPQGEKGDTGPQGKQGIQGDRGIQGEKGLPGEDGKDATIEIGNVDTLPPTKKASVTAKLDPETNVTTLNFGIPEGAAGRAIDIQGGIWSPTTLPPYDDTPINNAYIVYDGDKQFDLYIRGVDPVIAGDGGPWTIVENWQGRPGSGAHIVKKPYVMGENPGDVVNVPAAEGSLAFHPSDYLTDGDVLIDEQGNIGILGSTEDDSGDYTMTTVGSQHVTWDKVDEKPDFIEGFLEKVERDWQNSKQLNFYGKFKFDLPTLWDKDTYPELKVVLDFYWHPGAHNATSFDVTSLADGKYHSFSESFYEITGFENLPVQVKMELVQTRESGGISKDICVVDVWDNQQVEWEDLGHKPFSNVDTTGALRIEDDTLYSDPVTWESVKDKPWWPYSSELFGQMDADGTYVPAAATYKSNDPEKLMRILQGEETFDLGYGELHFSRWGIAQANDIGVIPSFEDAVIYDGGIVLEGNGDVIVNIERESGIMLNNVGAIFAAIFETDDGGWCYMEARSTAQDVNWSSVKGKPFDRVDTDGTLRIYNDCLMNDPCGLRVKWLDVEDDRIKLLLGNNGGTLAKRVWGVLQALPINDEQAGTTIWHGNIPIGEWLTIEKPEWCNTFDKASLWISAYNNYNDLLATWCEPINVGSASLSGELSVFGEAHAFPGEAPTLVLNWVSPEPLNTNVSANIITSDETYTAGIVFEVSGSFGQIMVTPDGWEKYENWLDEDREILIDFNGTNHYIPIVKVDRPSPYVYARSLMSSDGVQATTELLCDNWWSGMKFWITPVYEDGATKASFELSADKITFGDTTNTGNVVFSLSVENNSGRRLVGAYAWVRFKNHDYGSIFIPYAQNGNIQWTDVENRPDISLIDMSLRFQPGFDSWFKIDQAIIRYAILGINDLLSAKLKLTASYVTSDNVLKTIDLYTKSTTLLSDTLLKSIACPADIAPNTSYKVVAELIVITSSSGEYTAASTERYYVPPVTRLTLDQAQNFIDTMND